MFKLVTDKIFTYKLKVIILFIINIIITVLTLLNPYITGMYIDILTHAKNTNIIFKFILIYLSIQASKIFFAYLYNIIFLKLKLILTFDINKEFTKHIINLPMSFISDKKSIYLSQRVYSDSNKLIEFIFNDIYKFIATIFSLLIIIIGFVKINMYIVLLAFLSCLIYIYIFFMFTSKIQNSSYKFFEEDNKFSASINEPYEHIKYIKQNSILNIFMHRLQCNFNNFSNSKVIYGKVSYLYKNCTDSIYALSSVLVMLLCGVLVIQNKLSIGSAISTTNYFSIMLTSLGALLSVGQRYQEFKVSYERLNEIFKMEEVKNGYIEIDKIQSIELNSIKFNLNNTAILNNFNYSFESGNIYVICGKNGKGKSTLLNIISGVINSYEGCVSYNKINTNDINMIRSRHKNISFMPQDIFILKDTIKNNLYLDVSYYHNQNELLNDYVDSFNFKEYLDKYNKSIDDCVDCNLSGGEKQKIGLLRNAIKNSDLIIMDEPTSSLDKNTVQSFKNYLLKIKSSKIIIIVSHDERILEIADYKINLNESINEYLVEA